MVISMLSALYLGWARFGDHRPDFRTPKRKQIIAFVQDNYTDLCAQMDDIRRWGETYYYLWNREDQICGELRGSRSGEVTVTEPEIVDFMDRYGFIQIEYPADSDVIVFAMDGLGNVTCSVYMGFYYSPADRPAWVETMGSPYTGEHINYPVLPKGKGWVSDRSRLTPAENAELGSYQMYTERIYEDFFYYEVDYC